jgi:hypothetical protein
MYELNLRINPIFPTDTNTGFITEQLKFTEHPAYTNNPFDRCYSMLSEKRGTLEQYYWILRMDLEKYRLGHIVESCIIYKPN